MDNVLVGIVWLACAASRTIIAGVGALASRSRRARYVGCAAVGLLFIVGGALLHVINIASRGDYACFAICAFRVGDRGMAGRCRSEPGSLHRIAGGVPGNRRGVDPQRWT